MPDNKKRPSRGYRYALAIDRTDILEFTAWCRDRGFTATACLKAAIWMFMSEDRSPSEVMEKHDKK